MGLFERTIGRLGKAASQGAVAMGTWHHGTAAFPNLNYDAYVREGYQKNELVFACIEEWSTDIAEPELCVYKYGDEGPEKVENHPALEVFSHPNPFMSGDDFLSAVEMYKRLAGNAYEYKIRSAGNKVVQRWLLRPDRVRIVPDAEKFISHYEYRIGPSKVDIDPKDIVHHKTRNPYDDYYGMPPLMAASGRTDIDNFMKDIIKGYLQNTGVPAGILAVAGNLSDQEKALLRSRFRNEFGGANAGNIIVADGNGEAPKYTPMGMSLGTRGLVIPELDEMNEARIIMVFRIPLSIIGTRIAQIHSTLGASGREADRTFFTEQQLVPEWKSIASTYTMGYKDELLAEGEYFDFDLGTVKSLSENQDELFTRERDNLRYVVQSIQETRARIGLPPDPNPDDLFTVPVGYTVMSWKDLIESPEPIALQGEVMDDEEDEKLPAPPAPKYLKSGAPQVVVVNAQPHEVTKLFEYDDDGNVSRVIERTGE